MLLGWAQQGDVRTRQTENVFVCGWDPDYIASRHTLHKLGGASLPPRPPSSRLRNPGYGNNMQRPATDEDLAAHLSPREFLPTLPLDPPSPGSTTSRSTSSTRGPTSEGAVPLSQLQLPQDPQMSGSYSLRPITGLQVQDKTPNVAPPSRTMYRTPDIRGGIAPPRQTSSTSSSTNSTRFNTLTPPWHSPGVPPESLRNPGSQSQVRVNSLQLSLASRQPPTGHGTSAFPQRAASNVGDSGTHENGSNFTFDYGVPATTSPTYLQQSPASPAMTISSSPSAYMSTQLGQIRPRDPDSDLAHYETAGPPDNPNAPGQAILSNHNSDVLARPNKKSRTTKSKPKPTNQPRQSYQNKPACQLGHYRGEAHNFVRTFRYIASALMLAKNAFPNPQERREMLEEAWTQAEKVQPLEGSAEDLELDDDLTKLAIDAQKTFRNRIKREAEGAVNDMGEVFGIVPKNTIPKQEVDPAGYAAAIQANIQISALSRTNANLIFRQWRAQDEPRQGPFKNPAIERVLLVAFRSVDAEGAKGFYLFKDGMPAEAIALACTAIDVSLEEYSQGIHNKIEFTAISYRRKWEFYRNEWTRLRDRDSMAQDYTKRLQSELARQAAIACGKISAPLTALSLPAAITPDDILE